MRQAEYPRVSPRSPGSKQGKLQGELVSSGENNAMLATNMLDVISVSGP